MNQLEEVFAQFENNLKAKAKATQEATKKAENRSFLKALPLPHDPKCGPENIDLLKMTGLSEKALKRCKYFYQSRGLVRAYRDRYWRITPKGLRELSMQGGL